jgi:pimeloyl-ACP methyl ester carboxylesterase
MLLVRTITFPSHGDTCEADHLEARSDALQSPEGRPCVVMAHGFGTTRDCGLAPFAERFAAAGCDVLVFDYRGFGGSGGALRQDVDHRRHREDYHAAVAASRALPGVDPDRVAVWGTSYSGGHVLAVAAQDPTIAAVVSQGAAVDGLLAITGRGKVADPAAAPTPKASGKGAGIARAVLADLARAATRRPPRTIAFLGDAGSGAMISGPGAEQFARLTGPSFRNEMCARGVARIVFNRPVRLAADVRVPTLLVIAEYDEVAPSTAVHEVARRIGAPAEVVSYDCGHFAIYAGEEFEDSVARQVAFLRRVLAPGA